jgi:hypothetical protein
MPPLLLPLLPQVMPYGHSTCRFICTARILGWLCLNDHQPLLDTTRRGCVGVVPLVGAARGVADALVLAGNYKRHPAGRVLATPNRQAVHDQKVELEVQCREQIGAPPRLRRPVGVVGGVPEASTRKGGPHVFHLARHERLQFHVGHPVGELAYHDVTFGIVPPSFT